MHRFHWYTVRTLIAALAVATCALMVAPAGAAEATTHPPAQQMAAVGQIVDDLEADGDDLWYCPMHPEVESHEPGRCPECKMRLVRDATDPH